jgi:hypothetical protein
MTIWKFHLITHLPKMFHKLISILQSPIILILGQADYNPNDNIRASVPKIPKGAKNV